MASSKDSNDNNSCERGCMSGNKNNVPATMYMLLEAVLPTKPATMHILLEAAAPAKMRLFSQTENSWEKQRCLLDCSTSMPRNGRQQHRKIHGLQCRSNTDN